jgi:hypothetical protein
LQGLGAKLVDMDLGNTSRERAARRRVWLGETGPDNGRKLKWKAAQRGQLTANKKVERDIFQKNWGDDLNHQGQDGQESMKN